MTSLARFAAPIIATLLLSSNAFAEEAPLVIDLSPVETLEHDSNDQSGLTREVTAPRAAPTETNILNRNGIDPDISASKDSVGATQRIGLGARQAADENVNIKPYVELGAGVETRGDTPVISRSGVAADANATLGGGTTVNVNKQIDLRLGYTRKEPIAGGPRELTGQDAVETGVSIKF